MKPFLLLILTGLACSIPSLSAAESLVEPLEPLSMEVELGMIATTGNTESAALKGRTIIKQDFRTWKNKYQFDALYKRNTYNGVNETTTQKVFLSVQSDYKLSPENSSVFVFGSYTDDRFSGYDYQNTIAVGYSRRLFANQNSYLDYNIGPGYSFNRTDEGELDDTIIVHLQVEYEYNFSPEVKFTQTLGSDVALESNKNTISKSESAITSKLRDNLSMKAAYSITHNSEALDPRAKTDTTTSITMIYSF
jgi:putative salt-induced outer membrane protein